MGKLARVDHSKVVADYENGMSYAEIAAKYATVRHNVYKILKKAGVTLRGPARGSNHPSWKGGRVEKRGYVHVWLDPTDPLASMVPVSMNLRMFWSIGL